MLRETLRVGQRFRVARTAAKLTGQKAAEELGISGAYLSQIEHGKRCCVSTELIIKASRLYRVTVCYLLGMEEPSAFELMARLHHSGFFTEQHYHALWYQMATYAREFGIDPIAFVRGLDLDPGPELGKARRLSRTVDQPVPSDKMTLEVLAVLRKNYESLTKPQEVSVP